MKNKQQPIPQDINKWIEDEAKKERSKLLFTKQDEQTFYFGFNKCAQLLLPQLQECKEMNDLLQKMNSNLHEAMVTAEQRGIAKATEEFQNAYRAEVEQQKSQIEAQQEEIKQLKAKLELVVDWQYIMALERNINEQAAEIESLKQENERLKKESDVCYESRNKWKQRCEAAENVIHIFPIVGQYFNTSNPEKEKAYQKWQTLKQQTHG